MDELLNKWVEENSPMAIEKLAIQIGVSVAMLNLIRNGYIPSRVSTRTKLCRFFRVNMSIFKKAAS